MNDFTEEQLEVQQRFNEACAPAPIPAVEAVGILPGIPAHEYHRRELHVVSKSALDRIDRSPAHYQAWLHGYEQEQTAALKFGSALHMALLEPKRFGETYVVPPKFSGKGSVAAKAAWLAERPGRVTLSEGDEETVLGMLESVMRHPTASRLILDGESEVTVRWRDEITGLRCKSRADYYVRSKRYVVDIKTTKDASPDEFARSVWKYGYFKQDALYRAGFAACGEPISHFVILAIEKEPPFACAVYMLDEDAVTKGFNAARRGMERLAECARTNEWPSYSDGVCELALPHWAH